jgi:predicted DNA-binding transcriptional regulator AlpA
MQDLPRNSFPQQFPHAALCRLLSLGATPHQSKIAKIVVENPRFRVRQLWSRSGCNYMNTENLTIPTRTTDIHGLKSLFRLGRTAMYQLTRDPSFPKAYTITTRHYLWDLAEVEAWFVSRKAQRPRVRKTVATTPGDEIIDGIRFVKSVA